MNPETSNLQKEANPPPLRDQGSTVYRYLLLQSVFKCKLLFIVVNAH